MEDNIKTGRKAVPRVGLSSDGRAILQEWQKQLKETFPGIQISDGELVSWALTRRDTTLTADEIKELEILFFDEVKKLEWALAKARAAKSKNA